MTTLLPTLSIAIAAICACFLGVCVIICKQRGKRIRQLNREILKQNIRLREIADHEPHQCFYEIEEDELTNAYNVNMKLWIYRPLDRKECLDTVCYCLIKSFPFANDKAFAKLQAEELLDKLNEK